MVLVTNRLLSGRRVLVVEDGKGGMLVLVMTEGMLTDLGCDSIAAAATVGQALSLIDARTFDFAMLDMNLDGDKTYRVPTLSPRGRCHSSSRPATAVAIFGTSTATGRC